MILSALILGCRLAIGIVLVVAGVGKALRPDLTLTTLQSFGLPKDFPVRILGILLPPIEVVVGLSLISGLGLGVSGPAALAMFAVFTIAVSVSVAQGAKFPCRCFGQLGSHDLGPNTIARNVGLVLVSLVVVIADAQNGELARPTWQMAIDIAIGGVAVSMAGFLLILLYLLDQLDPRLLRMLRSPTLRHAGGTVGEVPRGVHPSHSPESVMLLSSAPSSYSGNVGVGQQESHKRRS